MYISRLNLRAFGKFVHKKMYFGSKLNIIFGENETGKSTLHNFIEAMMYGFNDENDKFNKYKPWSSSLYKGTIEMGDGEDKYLISRDFLLGTIQIFKRTNETNEFIEDFSSPGEYFFNINKTSYENTISISQLGNKTEKELADELKNKIINLSSTKDEEISIDRIMQNLYAIKEQAGNVNNDKTLLGQYFLRLKDLEAARENTVNSKRQVMFLAMEKKKIQSKIHELNLKIDEKKKEMVNYELFLEKQKFMQAEPIKKEIDSINEELKLYKDKINNSSKEDYKEAVETESTLASMKNDRQRMLDEKEEWESDLQAYLLDLANNIPENYEIDKLNSNYEIYAENIEKLKNLNTKIESGKHNISSVNIEEINAFINDYKQTEEIISKIEINNSLADNHSYESMKSFKKINGIKSFLTGFAGTLLLLAAIVSVYGGYYYGTVYYYGGALILPSIILYIFSLRNKKKSIGAKKEIESMECEFADLKLINSQLIKDKENIVQRYSCENFDNMSEIFSKKSAEKSVYEEKNKLLNYDENKANEILEENNQLERSLKENLKNINMTLSKENILAVNDAYNRKDFIKSEINRLNINTEQISKDIIRLEKEINFEQKRYGMILNSNGAESIESFKESVDINEKYKELSNRKLYLENIMDNIIGSADYYELKNKTKNVMDTIKEVDRQNIQLSIFKMNEEKSKYIKSIDDIHKEIEDIEHNIRGLAEIEEEIDFYEEKINIFKNKIKIAEIAAEKIAKISDSIRGDFMPLLRKSISDNFSYLTGGKYTEVIIDEDMNISVTSKEEIDTKIELESLSGGTLDQLYLSLRIALSNILSGKYNIPLILDDSFVQYDSKRLKKSLEMLSKESERRQVILFTCQERETEMAKQMNIKFNYIKL